MDETAGQRTESHAADSPPPTLNPQVQGSNPWGRTTGLYGSACSAIDRLRLMHDGCFDSELLGQGEFRSNPNPSGGCSAQRPPSRERRDQESRLASAGGAVAAEPLPADRRVDLVESGFVDRLVEQSELLLVWSLKDRCPLFEVRSGNG